MSRTTFLLEAPLGGRLAEYYRGVALREPPLLTALREETARLPSAQMQIAPEQGQLLGMLVRMLGARRCVEVGVYTGYSSLCVAQALPADGRLLACDVSEEWTTIARRYWDKAGVSARIQLKLAPALQTLDAEIKASGAGSYDFAFIDADKGNYRGYYERCLTLLRPGGVVAVDNTLWSGRVADTRVNDGDTLALRKFNKDVAADSRVDLCLVPIGDGMTLLQKK